MTDDQPRRKHAGVVDLPLPGHFEVITFQLNATFYPKVLTGKYVAILRDPIEQLEIQRIGSPEVRIADLLVSLDDTTTTVVRQALYMGGLDYRYRD